MDEKSVGSCCVDIKEKDNPQLPVPITLRLVSPRARRRGSTPSPSA
jgi:hypothetical protein